MNASNKPSSGDVDQLKEYLSDARYRIRLDDLISDWLREDSAARSETRFSLDDPQADGNGVVARLRLYEEVTSRLQDAAVLLGRWAERENRATLEQIIQQLTDFEPHASGKVIWIVLRWYPALLACYLAGMGALAGDNYVNLSTVLTTKVSTARSGEDRAPSAVGIIGGVDEHQVFKAVPGHEKNLVPRSEYLFEILRPRVDSLLSLGSGYERLFDRFEVILALVYADLTPSRTWVPPGRFSWKRVRGSSDPFQEVIHEADQFGTGWGPLRAGLFGSSQERLANAAKKCVEVFSQMNFW